MCGCNGSKEAASIEGHVLTMFEVDVAGVEWLCFTSMSLTYCPSEHFAREATGNPEEPCKCHADSFQPDCNGQAAYITRLPIRRMQAPAGAAIYNVPPVLITHLDRVALCRPMVLYKYATLGKAVHCNTVLVASKH